MMSYRERIIENNISGRVLVTCDLHELKDAMQMKFGDWQLFKAWINSARFRDNVSRFVRMIICFSGCKPLYLKYLFSPSICVLVLISNKFSREKERERERERERELMLEKFLLFFFFLSFNLQLTNSTINRSEKSFYRPCSRSGNSCADGSQTESIPDSPKQSSIGSFSQNPRKLKLSIHFRGSTV